MNDERDRLREKIKRITQQKEITKNLVIIYIIIAIFITIFPLISLGFKYLFVIAKLYSG